MKKAMLLAVCLILAGLLAVNGTFAAEFTQAINNAVNSVFKIVENLLENAKPAPGGTAVDVELVSQSQPQQIYPGGTATYTTAVKNNGTQDAYFRLAFAVQYDAETWEDLDISCGFDTEKYDQTDGWMPITLSNGIHYKMKVLTYLSPLAPKSNAQESESPEVTITISMDASITSQQLDHYQGDFMKVQVLAIGADEFVKTVNGEQTQMSAEEALKLALPIDANFNPF